MARLRTIKPGFFRNEKLGVLAPLDRLLFAGLWCWCDREGRIEDRVGRIRADVLPYDNVTDKDVDGSLTRLAETGFIIRYTRDDVDLIQVLTWDKHQNPHKAEAKSVLAAYKHGTSTMRAPCKHSERTALAGRVVGSGDLSLGSGDLGLGVKASCAPPEPAPADAREFEDFWTAYPRKVGKIEARKAWNRLSKTKDWPGAVIVIAAVGKQRTSEAWTKDGGQFIPHPTTWLNGGRWSDEIRPAANGQGLTQDASKFDGMAVEEWRNDA